MTHVPFKFDYVGSFLRPESLIKARENYETGKIDYSTLKEIEDKAIIELIQKQKASGYHVITDGEFRRKSWHLDFMWGLNGIKRIELSHGYYFKGLETYHASIEITGKISGESHPFVEHFKFVKQFEDKNVIAKQTIPAPAQLLSELYRQDNLENTKKFYPNEEELIQDIANAYKQVIKELYDAGCRNLQLDDCTWGMIVDDEYWIKKVGKGVPIDDQAKKYLRINNLALEDKPQDLHITTHICRGNYQSTYAASGAYDKIAPILFPNEHVEAFYLEYDDERSGDFKALQYIPKDKNVVLGLVTTKRAELEDSDTIKKRIQEATQYISLEQISISPQCGFSSNDIGNKITDEDQWRKLSLVKSIAEEVLL